MRTGMWTPNHVSASQKGDKRKMGFDRTLGGRCRDEFRVEGTSSAANGNKRPAFITCCEKLVRRKETDCFRGV